MKNRLRWNSRLVSSACCLGTCLFLQGLAPAADRYDAAVANPARSAADLKRDTLDRPADILRVGGIAPGMKVADLLAADGYYSELLSYVVGSKGHVVALNNPAFDGWSDGARQARYAGHRLANVEPETVDLNNMHLKAASLDAVLLIKVYHDLYWVDSEGKWPPVNPNRVLAQLSKALKPHGTLLVVDHSAKFGTGSADASTLHRIDETYAVKDIESHGFIKVGHSDVLRRADDGRDQVTYKGPMVGKTDRFVLVFRKAAERRGR